MNGLMKNRIKEQGINPEEDHLKKVLQLTQQYIGFPRQLGSAYRRLCYYAG